MESDGDADNKERLVRVYGRAIITENWVGQGKQTDRTTLDNLNDNNATIDDDHASSFNTRTQ